MNRKSLFVFVILLNYFLQAPIVEAQSNSLMFKHLSVAEGLSQSTVFTITQDSKGFMWFGTRTGGLNRYDGASMKVYKNDSEDPYSISGNEVLKILEDSKGRIWIGTRNAGINRFDFEKEQFHPYLNYKLSSNKRDFRTVVAIAEDYKGRIWAGTQGGLYLYKPEKDNFFEAIDNKTGQTFIGNSALCIVRDSILCIGTKQGVYLYNTNSMEVIKKFNHTPENPKSLSGNYVISMHYDSKDHLWLGTRNNGLNLLTDLSDSSFIHFKHATLKNTSLSNNVIRSINEDRNGNIWISTNEGLNKLIPNEFYEQQPKFTRFLNDPENDKSLTQDILFSFFEDAWGNLWIGTWSRGVVYLNTHSKKFDNFRSNKNKRFGLVNDNVNCFTESKQGIWVGTDGGGVSLFDRKKNIFLKHLAYKDNASSLIPSNNVRTLYTDTDNSIWIGGFEGLSHYNYDKGISEIYFEGYIINYIVAGIGDELWLGTSTCLINFNKKDKTYKQYYRDDEDSSSLADNNINILYKDTNNTLWFGTKKGLHKYNREQDNFSRYQHDAKNNKSISNNYVISINNDNKGNLWIGTYDGLNMFNLEDQNFTRYNEKDGLPDNVIQGILTDEHGRLWLSTNKGLVMFTLKKNNGNSLINIKHYSKDDGLQGNEFIRHAYLKTQNNELLFGGTHGFNIFYPDSIKDNLSVPDIIFTELKLFNKPVEINDNSGILSRNIALTKEIRLLHTQTVISFEFAALNFMASKKNQYAYKMEGFDKDWVEIGNKNVAHYTSLPAGKYTFKVKASNNDGIWNNEGASIRVIVLPPWWKTWLFRISLVMLLIALVLGIYYYRLKSIRNQNSILEKKVKERTKSLQEVNATLEDQQKEIKLQNEELEKHRSNLELLVKDRTSKLETALLKAKESDELKSAFMANMSHEIRTPMNAITGFSSLLNEKDVTADEQAGYIEIIQSNSKTLLTLIDEILDLSLIESNQLKINKENFHLNAILDHLYSYYYLSNNSSKRDIIKRNLLDDFNLVLHTDSVRLKQIITNLMDNAMKFTEEGHIKLGAFRNETDLFIFVEDTGKGIPPKEIDNIFKQFTKVEGQETEWTQGLGLGLAISQKIANTLGGKILVESEIGKGSKFTFRIPLDTIEGSKDFNIEDLKEPVLKSWQGKTIMIVEDVEANYLYLNKVLRKAEVNTIWTKNGKEAVDMVLSNKPINLILMDIKMPIMNGYEAAKEIKKHNANQIIIAQTAYARPEERLQFHDENFDDYLAKPISPINLKLILEKFL